MSIRVERVEIDGESRRRFFLIAEVTFGDSSPDTTPYYDDYELAGRIEGWVDAALNDRDDSPSIRFLEVPKILEVDIESIARGDYPRSGY